MSSREKLLQMDPIGIAAWSASVVVGLLIGFVVITIAFVAWEIYQRHNDRALIPLRLIKDRNVWPLCLFTFFNAGTMFLIIYLLPIYFQSIDGVPAIESGVRNLPLIVGMVIASLGSGVIIGATGIAQPFLCLGVIMSTVATGLLYTLDIGSGSPQWIGYQAFAGLGWGLSFQVPMIIAQGTATPQDLPLVTATILFFQTVGGAMFLSAGQGLFLARTISHLRSEAPALNPLLVIAAGATRIRDIFPSEVVPVILSSYIVGLKVGFAIAIGGVGVGILASCTGKWKRLDIKALQMG